MLYARSASISSRGLSSSAVSISSAWAGLMPAGYATLESRIAYDNSNNMYIVNLVIGTGYVIYKIDSNGNLIYQKQLTFNGTAGVEIVVNDSYMYLACIYGNLGTRNVMVSKLNTSDGSIVWSKTITPPVSIDSNSCDCAYDVTNDRLYVVASQLSTLYIFTLDPNGSVYTNLSIISNITAGASDVLANNGYLYIRSRTEFMKISIGTNGIISSMNAFSFTVTGYSVSSVNTMNFMTYGTTSNALALGYIAFNSNTNLYYTGIAGFDVSSSVTQLGSRLYTGYNGNLTTTPAYNPTGITSDGTAIYMNCNSNMSPSTYRLTTLKINPVDRTLIFGKRLSSTTNGSGLYGYDPSAQTDNLISASGSYIWALPKNGSIPGTGTYNVGGITYTYTTSTLSGTATPAMTKTTLSRTTSSGTTVSSSLSLSTTDRSDTYTRTGL